MKLTKIGVKFTRSGEAAMIVNASMAVNRVASLRIDSKNSGKLFDSSLSNASPNCEMICARQMVSFSLASRSVFGDCSCFNVLS